MSEPATLWLDTSVVWSARHLRELAEAARASGVKLVVPAQVHLESCRQTRTLAAKSGKEFSAERFRGILDQLGVEVAEIKLDLATAEAWGEILAQRYPTADAWKAAKLDCVKGRLPDEATLPAESVPMTTDWLMALEVEHRGFYVAVGDKGCEWDALRTMNPKRALSYDEALAWLHGRRPLPPTA